MDESRLPTLRSLPISAELALRLHESGGEEERARLVYALCACLDPSERWLAAAFKRPQDLRRWALAGVERWGLAPEFEPLRRLARAEQWQSIADGARGSFNEAFRCRLAHLACLAWSRPCMDHLYWCMVMGAVGFGAWSLSDFGSWLGRSKGPAAEPAAWLAGAAFLAMCMKSALRVWQGSSEEIGAALRAMVWGRKAGSAARGLADALPMLAEEPSMGGRAKALRRKARRGALAPMEAMELARARQAEQAWDGSLPEALVEIERRGRSAIDASKEPGWALAKLEAHELSSACGPRRGPELPGPRGRL